LEIGGLHTLNSQSELPATALTYQVEDGNLSVRDFIEVSVEILHDGHYQLIVRHTALEGYKRNQLLIDGDCYGEFISNLTNCFVDANVCTVYFNAGLHTIRIEKAWGGIYVDRFILIPTEAPKLTQPAFNLTNPNATSESKSLMKYFKDVYGEKIITGQHTAAASGPELDFIQNVTGKLPALRGFDLLSYSLTTETADPTEHKIIEINENKGSIEKAIEWYTEKNGIVTICWHWYAPTGGKDKAFYTENTDFDLEAGLTPGTKEYHALLADMDEIASQLKKLQDANIPVLWRPLHEADGRWFWWGAKGPEAYKKLYIWMVDYYTNHHQLNNLIWVWNAPNPEWYPGDDYVDIAGVDIYVPSGNYGPIKMAFDYAAELTNFQKPIALTENGPIPDPDKLIATQTPWLWYMPWYGEFVTGGKSTTVEHLKKVYDHPYCITLDQLPDLKTY